VDPTGTLGGVLYLGASLNLTVLGLIVSDITAKGGAALYICVVPAIINTSRFENLTASESGGAILYGPGSSFNMNGMSIV
jgi:hypothetical protein